MRLVVSVGWMGHFERPLLRTEVASETVGIHPPSHPTVISSSRSAVRLTVCVDFPTAVRPKTTCSSEKGDEVEIAVTLW